MELVDQLEKRLNAGDVVAVMELFAPDATVSIPALDPRRGLDEIEGLFEFCVGINVRWTFKEAVVTDGRADCRVDQHDGWSALLGLAPLQYETFRVTVSEGRIADIEGTWTEETLHDLGNSLESFTPWALEHHPHLYGPDGSFRYTREAGTGFIAAATEWLAEFSSAGPQSPER